MNSYEYIQEVKKNAGLETDYAVAKFFGWTPQKIYQYREGQSMDNEAARRVAEALDVPVLKVIADMEVQRAKDEPTRKAWKMLSKLSKQSGRATAKFLISLPFLAFGVQVLYIMLNSVSKKLCVSECEPSL